MQNSYFAEHLWMAVSVSVTFLLIFKNRYILEQFSVAALIYICSKIFKSFSNFMSEYKDEYFICD